MVERDMDAVAAAIDLVLKGIKTPGETAAIEAARIQVAALSGRYPLPYRR